MGDFKGMRISMKPLEFFTWLSKTWGWYDTCSIPYTSPKFYLRKALAPQKEQVQNEQDLFINRRRLDRWPFRKLRKER
jgi:hypothetical protein